MKKLLIISAISSVAAVAGAALVPISPTGGESVPLVPDAQKKAMAPATLAERIALFREDRESGGKVMLRDKFWRKSRPFILKWRTSEGETGPWKIEFSANPDFTEPAVHYVSTKAVDITTGREIGGGEAPEADEITCSLPRTNLEVGRAYWWRITGLGKPPKGSKTGPAVHSSVAAFVTEDLPPRWIELEGRVGNIRDLGGWRTTNGHRVRQGMAFRGQGLNDNSVTGERQGRNRLMVEDVKFFTRTLGIRTDLDLRGKPETADLDESPLGMDIVFIQHPSPCYRGIFTKDGKKNMAQNVRVFCNPGNYPIYFHCIGGADRTGSLAYVLLGVLGVAQHDIETDWESTFYPNIPDDKHEAEPDFWCRESHLTDGIGKYGRDGDSWQRRCELYLHDCGITDEEIAALRRILLDNSAD